MSRRSVPDRSTARGHRADLDLAGCWPVIEPAPELGPGLEGGVRQRLGDQPVDDVEAGRQPEELDGCHRRLRVGPDTLADRSHRVRDAGVGFQPMNGIDTGNSAARRVLGHQDIEGRESRTAGAARVLADSDGHGRESLQSAGSRLIHGPAGDVGDQQRYRGVGHEIVARVW
ncbi:MAG: hypothetical protein M5U31_06880 [Acidimicrobiia bacterium]|nr:hypothetical protein [Acidimicrobiia bacterium]